MWKKITAKYLPNIELGIFKHKKYLAEAKNHYEIKACMHAGSRRDAWACMLICWLHARRWQEGPVWSHSDFFDLVSDYTWYISWAQTCSVTIWLSGSNIISIWMLISLTVLPFFRSWEQEGAAVITGVEVRHYHQKSVIAFQNLTFLVAKKSYCH